MIPARHPRTTRRLGKPADWDGDDPHCAGLAVCDLDVDGTPVMQSVWEPTPAELSILNSGGFVVLNVVGAGHPPVSINAWHPDAENRK